MAHPKAIDNPWSWSNVSSLDIHVSIKCPLNLVCTPSIIKNVTLVKCYTSPKTYCPGIVRSTYLFLVESDRLIEVDSWTDEALPLGLKNLIFLVESDKWSEVDSWTDEALPLGWKNPIFLVESDSLTEVDSSTVEALPLGWKNPIFMVESDGLTEVDSWTDEALPLGWKIRFSWWRVMAWQK